MQSYETATLDQLTRDDGWSPIRKQLGSRRSASTRGRRSEVGDQLISEHDEVPSGHEELYLVVAGRATFTVDGDEVDAPTGTLVFVRDPAAKRGAVARRARDDRARRRRRVPGEAYRPRSWEMNVDVFPLFDAGQFAEAKQLLLDALEVRGPRHAALQPGLRRGAAGRPRCRVRPSPGGARPPARTGRDARVDHDLESLHDDPRFGSVG